MAVSYKVRIPVTDTETTGDEALAQHVRQLVIFGHKTHLVRHLVSMRHYNALENL